MSKGVQFALNRGQSVRINGVSCTDPVVTTDYPTAKAWAKLHVGTIIGEEEEDEEEVNHPMFGKNNVDIDVGVFDENNLNSSEEKDDEDDTPKRGRNRR